MADLQALIDAGMSPLDAASLAADLQRYETSGVPNLNLGVAPQSTTVNGVEYQNQYGGMDIIPGLTSSILANLGIENPQLPVYTIREAQAQKDPMDARRMSFMPTPGSAYRLVDTSTGNVVMSATTPEEYAALAQRANEIAASEGKKANFQIQRQSSPTFGGGWSQIYSDTPDVAFDTTAKLMLAGMLAMTGAGALQPGGFGGVGAAAPAATGTGLGAGTSLAAQGLSSLPANLAAIQAGANTALAGAGLGTAALAPAAASSLLPVATEAGIVVTAPAAAATGLEAIAPLAIGTGTAAGALSSAGGAGAGSTAPSATGSETAAGATPEEIVVTAQKPLTLGTIGPLTPVTQLPELLQSLANTVPPITPEPVPPTSEVGPIDTVKEPGFLDKVTSALRPSDYLKLASLGISTIGGLLGGGGGSGATYTGAGTALNPRFSAKLPAPTMPGASSNFAVRPAAEIGTVNGQPRDWTQYGFGPEASFFSYVPQRGYAHGGEAHGDGPDRSFAVQGPGDGRSDEIPAMLSDGEYVMDAETVALLGNGSPKAGAQVLDEFRVNVRKHKGQKLAKGEFSVNAKKPERYLAGGRI